MNKQNYLWMLLIGSFMYAGEPEIHTARITFNWKQPFLFVDQKTQWMDSMYKWSLYDIPGIHYGCNKFPRVMRFIAGAGCVCLGGFVFNKLKSKRNLT